MPRRDSFILMGMGGFFVLLGLGLLFWGKREGKDYYNSTATRHDMREFLEHSPERPESGALVIGGWISIALGLVLLIVGLSFMLSD